MLKEMNGVGWPCLTVEHKLACFPWLKSWLGSLRENQRGKEMTSFM